jgi:hypothetical protein
MGLDKNAHHPKGEKTGGPKMMLTGKLHQVTLKRVKDSSSGRMGLAWLHHCMEHYGLTLMLDQVSSKAKGSNREISSSRKVMSLALCVIGGGDRVEDIEVLRQDQGLLGGMIRCCLVSGVTHNGI